MINNTLIASLLSAVFYLIAASLPCCLSPRYESRSRRWLILFGVLAVAWHGLLLHQWIDIGGEQNLTVLNLLSLLAWLLSVLVLIVLWFKPIDLLVLLVFPLAALSILAVQLFPASYLINAAANPDVLIHILSAVITSSVLSLAGLLALVLAVQDYALRRHKNHYLLTRLPPLQSAERLLFQIIAIGFILLSGVVGTSVYWYHDQLLNHSIVLQKLLLVVLAWLIFAVLLVGRYWHGWRGRKAIYITLAGVLVLGAVYLSKVN